MNNKEVYNILCGLYPKKEKRYLFITNCLFYFKIDFIKFAEFLDYNPDYLYKTIIEYSNNIKKNLQFIIDYPDFCDEFGLDKFLNYLEKIKEAIHTKDTHKITELVKMVTDFEANKIYKEKQNRALIDSDIVPIFLYQYKYYLSTRQIEKIFHVDLTAFIPNVKNKIKELNDPELTEKYNRLEDVKQFYLQKYRKENLGKKR